MPTPTVAERYLAATEKSEDASQIVHDFANGDSTSTVTTASGAIPTLAKFIADQTAAVGDAIDQAIVDAGFDARLDTLESTTGTHTTQIAALQTTVGNHGGRLTAVEDAVGSATTTKAGIIKLATAAEATAGTDASRAVTPATLLAVFENNTSINGLTGAGSIKLPNGMMLQWLRHYPASGDVGGSNITFPTPFTTAVYYISKPTLIASGDGVEGNSPYIRNDWTLTGCRMTYSGAPNAQLTTNGVFIFALGK